MIKDIESIIATLRQKTSELTEKRISVEDFLPCVSDTIKKLEELEVDLFPEKRERSELVYEADEKHQEAYKFNGNHQESLFRSEYEFRTLAESMPQIVWVTTPDGLNIYFNHKWVDYTGLTLEESYGHGWIKPFHPDDKRRAWNAWDNATKNNGIYSLECRLLGADGIYRWWLVRGVPFLNEKFEIIRWYGTCTDIESIKNTEKELRQNEEKYRSLFNNSEVGMFTTRLDGSEILEFNEKYLKILNYSQEEVIGKPSVNIWADKNERAEMVRILNAEGRVTNFECKLLTKQGNVRNCITSLRLYPENGILEGSIYDITERKIAEEALHLSGQKLALHVQQTPLAVIEFDVNGYVREWNPAAVQMFGFNCDEAIGNKWTILVPESDRIHVENVWNSISNQKGGKHSSNKNITKKGDIIFCEWFNTPLIDSKGETIGVISLVMDNTEHKRAEDALNQSEENYRTLFKKSQDAIFLIDLVTGYYLDANKAAESLTGRSVKELKKLRTFEISPKGSKKRLERMLSNNKNHHVGELEYLRPDGSTRMAILNTIALRNNRVFGMAHDITEQKQAEVLLQIKNDALIQANSELIKAKEYAEESEFFLKESQKVGAIGSYKTNFIKGYWESSTTLDLIFGIDNSYQRSISGWLDIVHPDEKSALNDYLINEVIGKRKNFEKEYRISRINDKKTRWVQGFGATRFDSSWKYHRDDWNHSGYYGTKNGGIGITNGQRTSRRK